MSLLEIRVIPLAGVPRAAEIVLGGPVSAPDARALKETLERQVAAGVVGLALLMKSVSYMNSAGLACLVETATALERRGGSLVLVEVQPKVKVVLSNLGMNRYFRFESSPEEARAFLRAQAERLARAPSLVVVDGPEAGAAFSLGDVPVRLGSDPQCTIVVRHAEAERIHAEIYRKGDRIFVKDLGSRAGTFVGERRVAEEALREGDVVRVANLRLSLRRTGA